MGFLGKLKEKYNYHIHNIGKEVYWDTPYDPMFHGYYKITSKMDKEWRIKIYNDKVGERLVPIYYVEIVKDRDRNIK